MSQYPSSCRIRVVTSNSSYSIQNRFIKDFQCIGSGNLKINKIKSLPFEGLKPTRGADKQEILTEITPLPQETPMDRRGYLTKPREGYFIDNTCRLRAAYILILFNLHNSPP